MRASSFLNFQSSYQIHLNLIIFKTWGEIFTSSEPSAIRKQPVFSNNVLKKVSSLLSSLHASPVHWVIKILLSFAESLSCHLSRLFSSSSHVSIAAPILSFIMQPHPVSLGWILSVWFSGSM